MKTTAGHPVAGRALALLCALFALAALAPRPATAQAAPTAAPPTAAPPTAAAPTADRILDAGVQLGYRATKSDKDRSLLYPYDPLDDTAVLGLDIFYLTPQFGTLRLEAGYAGEDSRSVDFEYYHGADFDLRVGNRAFTHARQHEAPVPRVDLALPPPSTGRLIVEPKDDDPGRRYRDELGESTAAVRVRAPGYPAHLRASGRIFTNQGTRQMPYFFRNCSTSACHVNSRARELDQVTKDYTLGLDAHAGPVDLAYSHTAQTFRDDAPDPVLALPGMPPYVGGVPAGDYPHDVNPDLRSFSDSLRLNTALANRVVLSLDYAGGEQENQTSGVSTRTRSGGAVLSWRPAASAFFTGRYQFEAVRSGDLSAAAAELRTKRNAGHLADGFNHQHVLDPQSTRHTGELSARFSPIATADVTARLRYRTLARNTILEKIGDTYVDETEKTRSTLATLQGRLRPTPELVFDASLGREWTDGPVYAVETTGVVRYGLGATWTPAPVFLVRAAWQGYRGENDDDDALRTAYAATPTEPANPGRTVTGDALMVSAAFVPAPEFNLTASWGLTDNGVEQDLIIGGPVDPVYTFVGRDTSWSGRTSVADLRARWAAATRLTLTVEGLWIEGRESYAPTFPQGAELEQIGTVDFTKLVGSLQAELRLTDAVGLTVAAFWARYDDQGSGSDDGTAEGVLAAVDMRW